MCSTINAVAACSSVNACTSGHHLLVKSLRTETVSCISVSSPKVPDTSLWNEQKKDPVSEARGLAAATCTFLGQGLMAPQTCLPTWGSQVCSADVTAAGHPVLAGGWYFVACTVSAAWNPSEAWAARSHGPVSITTQPGVLPEGFANPLHKHIRLGGCVLLQRSSQLAASTHTRLLSFGLLQLPMPAALCPGPRSSGSHRLPLPSWGHRDPLLPDSIATVTAQR